MQQPQGVNQQQQLHPQEQQHHHQHHHQQHHHQQQQGHHYQRNEPGLVGSLHVRRPGSKIHFCICCQHPIAVYGRLLPCMHTFCLACAADMPKCYICLADILRMERLTSAPYMSAVTLQSFLTEDQLAKHTVALYEHLSKQPAFGGATATQQQQLAGAGLGGAGAGWPAAAQ